MTPQSSDKIEILSVALLDQQRAHVNALKQLARSLGLEFGWHYLLDMSWILSQIGELKGKRILDAGAGTGVLQWYMAQQGAQVISVDRLSRANLPLRFRTRFRVRGLRKEDLHPWRQVLQNNLSVSPGFRSKVGSQAREFARMAHRRQGPGEIVIYNQDLISLQDIADSSLDAVVAVSALEHNPQEGLGQVVLELVRVLKPGGVLAASLNAAREADWWHAPSSGWCYSEASLRRLFQLGDDIPSNYNQFDRLFEELRDCRELRDNLAGFYFKSEYNGMPWGKWDPLYIPVGVLKVKPQAGGASKEKI